MCIRDRAIGVVRDVKTIEGVGVEMAGCKGPGTERLSLESLFRPAAAHLVGDDALDIVLYVHDVDDRQLFPGAADVLKVTVIAVTSEPGHGLSLIHI